MAFRVSDIENRSRKDISDWERAKEYSRALDEFYNSNQSEMAEHLKISKSWLSRLLDVARLPSEIVAAFPDTHGITVRVARDIKPLTSDRRALDLMIAESRAIVAERDDLGTALPAPEIAKRLIRATVAPVKSTNSDAEVKGANGKVILRYAHSARSGYTFKVPARSGASATEVLKAIEAILTS